jgi:hypothetical protein
MAPRGRDRDDEDDDDDIGQYVLEGKELKRAIKRGRRRPVPFAFCPVAGDELTWFASHKKKPAVRIAKKTKRESGQFKVAFGTYVVEGKLIVLSCEEVIPQLARRMKKHLARENIRMNVRVLDLAGVEIDADIEAMADEGEDDGDGEDDDDAPGAPAATAPRDPGPRRTDFSERLEAVQGPVLAARGLNGDRLRDMLGGVFAAQDKGDRAAAETLLDRLEDHVRQLMNSAARPNVAPSRRDAPPPSPEPPAIDRKAQVALARRAADLRDRTALLAGDAGARLAAALDIGARLIRSGDLPAAAGAIDRIGAAVERAEAEAGRPPR